MSNELVFDPQRAITLYQSGNYPDLTKYFLDVLAAFRDADWRELTPDRSHFVNRFLAHFGALFTQQDYVIAEEYVARFVSFAPVISNMAAMSCFRTTDPWLEILRYQKANLVKILTLLNARSRSRFSAADIFTADPQCASIWYRTYFEVFHCGAPTITLWNNGREHIDRADPRFSYIGSATGDFYFFLSYLALEKEAGLKRLYHNVVRPRMGQATVQSHPNPKSIAIVTARWNKTSAVYKSLAPFVEALRDDYELTLVRLVGAGYGTNENFDKSWFKAIRNVTAIGDKFDLTEISKNDFSLTYFPDIGMQPEDRMLCNLRIAPIQVMGYGHPVSTHGGQIDYFIGGREVERLEDAQRNYSERLVAIPGLGAFPVLPPHVGGDQRPATNPLIVNCAWTGYKCVHPHLVLLRRIGDLSNVPVVFRFFIGKVSGWNNQAVPFAAEMEEVIGSGRVQIITDLPYPAYQQRLREGAFALDSHPFGGYNTIVDSIAVCRPVVVLEGRHAVNRLAAAVLRRVGLSELIARDADEYVTLALKVLADREYRESLYERLRRIDLTGALCRAEEPKAFKRAIEFLLTKHSHLAASGSRDPIVVD